MPITEDYRVCAVKIGATTIGQITDQEVTEDLRLLLARDSASVYHRAASADLLDSRVRFTTEAVKTALNAVPLTGTPLATLTPAVVYFAKYTDGGGIAANGCVTFTYAKGVALLRSISAAEGRLASVSIEIIGVSPDGTTHPAEKATGVAVPTVATEEMFTVGSPAGIVSLSIETGIAEHLRRDGAETFYTLVAYDLIQPTVRYSLAAMAVLGVVDTIAEVTLIDCLQGAARGTSPITITLNQSIGAARRVGGGPNSTDYEATPTWDGTNAPIATPFICRPQP